MSKNPFKQQKAFAPSLNRNNFDLSFTNNGTFNFGYLYPVLCHEVLPGDKTVIDPRMALRAFPLVFPIQTRVRAHIHFFYQRNRNLWKGFPDFINGNIEAESPEDNRTGTCSPFIDDHHSPRLFRTGSLGDYLGIPTTIPNNVNILADDVMPLTFMYPEDARDGLANIYPYRVISASPYTFTDNNRLPDSANLVVGRVTSCKVDDYLITNYAPGVRYDEIPANNIVDHLFRGGEKTASNMIQCYAGVVFPSTTGVHRRVVFQVSEDNVDLKEGRQFALFGHLSAKVGDADISDDPDAAVLHDGEVYHKVPVDVTTSTTIGGEKLFRISCDLHNETTAGWSFVLFCGDVITSSMSKTNNLGPFGIRTYNITKELDYINNGSEVFTTKCGNAVSALPFRCYESIYNAFYRDSRNNPFIDRGVTKFNEYLPSVLGGLDTYPYQIHRRNWELDMFTSCVQSPQQGVAPLVGISSLGEVTFSDENGKAYTFATETAADSDTITNVKVTENVPNSVARSIVNLVSSGISINDFRNVNAFQRWKETNIRRGLKFKDQIKARWGVDVGYNTLDMPEFLGGMSVDIDVNAVNQMSDSPDAPLGSYAGQATAFGSTNNKISCYSDEHGFIMAILSIVPVPCYSQTLPRYFRRFSPLDYYNPEFGKIGMQAVTYRDLCPINAVLSHANNLSGQREELDKVFGYNRPWPEYLSRFDEVHGEFRTTLKDFLLMREFAGLPELGSDFTTVNPDDLNNVFATEYGDKFLGAIYFDIKCKRPIPSISVPALE